MNFVTRHKAFLITALISGTLILGMFYISIKNKSVIITEHFYEVDPQTEDELKKVEETKDFNVKNKPVTNQALNEDEAFKEMMRNFKTVQDAPATETETKEIVNLENTTQNTSKTVRKSQLYPQSSKQHALQEKDRQRFRKAKDIVLMQTTKNSTNNYTNNSNSSVSYSLKNRLGVKLPPPIYLCETSGKIIVNITVNAFGQVTDAYINTSSSSTNQCLIDTAITYAKNAVFSEANRKHQIGSITYYFSSK